MDNYLFQYPAVERHGVRAIEGDTMWVQFNPIKADKCAAFEHFVHDILKPAVQQIHPEMRDKTRLLHPTRPNPDGTYTYIFLMDPLIPNADYQIEDILKQVYPEEKAKEYENIWNDCFASAQIEFVVKQSGW